MNFSDALEAKYSILAQHAAADMMRAQAEASYRNAMIRQMTPQNMRDDALNRATIKHMGAQSGMLGAQTTAQQQQNTAFSQTGRPKLPDLPSSGGGLGDISSMFDSTPMDHQPVPLAPVDSGAGGGFGATPPRPSKAFSADVDTPYISRASQGTPGNWSQVNQRSNDIGIKSVQPTFHDNTPDGMEPPNSKYGLKGMQISPLKRGTARVPGKGSPKKDTVPAVLAPGEAVLNAPAAEMAGRGNIAALNRKGAGMMGMRPGKGNMPGHYATGTAEVGMRSTSPRDLLPPVLGGGLSAPNDPRANLPPVVGPTMSQGPLPPRSLPPVVGPTLSQGPLPPRSLPPVVGPTLSQGPVNPGDGASNFVRGMLGAPEPVAAPPVAAPPAMPHIDHGPQIAAPAGPHWAMPHPGGVPLPPVARPPGLGGYAAPAPTPSGGVDDYMAAHNLSFGGGSPAPAPRADLGAERARSGSFGEAFAAARKAAGGGKGMFEWTNPRTGKTGQYRTNIRGER